MSKVPTISIVMSTYDRPNILVNRSIKSILNQTFADWQLNVVGDGPPNNETKEAMAKIKDDRIIYTELSKNGPYPDGKRKWFVAGANALNKALELSAGIYIAHLDDDDEWYPDHLEKLFNLIETDNYDIVYSKALAKFPEFSKREDKVYGGPVPMQNSNVCHMSIMYKSKFKDIKYKTDLDEPGDWHRINAIQQACDKIGHLDEITCVWHVSESMFIARGQLPKDYEIKR